MKYLLFLIFLIACGENTVPKESGLNSHHLDSDLDGVSNAEEFSIGSDPFINKSYIDHYLGEASVKADLRLKTDKIFMDKISLLGHENSVKYFYEEEVINKTFIEDSLNKVNHSAAFKNVLACMHKMQFKGLDLKHPNNLILDLRLRVLFDEFEKLYEHEKTKFYLYDFKEMNEFILSANKDEYESSSKTLSDRALKNGFCILYDKLDPSKKNIFDGLQKIVKINKEIKKIELSLAKKEYYSQELLKQKLKLAGLKEKNGVYYKANSLEAKLNTKKASTLNDDFKIGDKVLIYDFVEAKFNSDWTYKGVFNRNFRIPNFGGSRGRMSNPKCSTYFRVASKYNKSFKIEEHLIDDFKIKINQESFIPKYIVNNMVAYEVKLRASHFVNKKLNISFKDKTSKLFNVPVTSRFITDRGDKCFNTITVNQDIEKKLKHNIFIERRGER